MSQPSPYTIQVSLLRNSPGQFANISVCPLNVPFQFHRVPALILGSHGLGDSTSYRWSKCSSHSDAGDCGGSMQREYNIALSKLKQYP